MKAPSTGTSSVVPSNLAARLPPASRKSTNHSSGSNWKTPGKGRSSCLFDGLRLAAVHLQVEGAAPQHRLAGFFFVRNVHRDENLFLFLAALNHDRGVIAGHEFPAVDAHEFERVP